MADLRTISKRPTFGVIALSILCVWILTGCATPSAEQACAGKGYQQGSKAYEDCVTKQNAIYEWSRNRARSGFGMGSGG